MKPCRLVGAVIMVLFVPCISSADVVASKQRMDLFRQQTKLLDSRAAEQYSDSVRLQPQSFEAPTKWGGFYSGSYSGKYLDMAKSAALRHGVPQGIFLRLVQQESGWNNDAVSSKGAIGLAQLMPETASKLHVNPHDPSQNLDGGARYLAAQYREFGSWPLALAAYNAGPQVVRRYGGVPPYEETRNYVKAIYGHS